MLEETIINFKKKYEGGSQYSDKSSTGGKYKELYNDLLAEFEKENLKMEEERAKHQ